MAQPAKRPLFERLTLALAGVSTVAGAPQAIAQQSPPVEKIDPAWVATPTLAARELLGYVGKAMRSGDLQFFYKNRGRDPQTVLDETVKGQDRPRVEAYLAQNWAFGMTTNSLFGFGTSSPAINPANIQKYVDVENAMLVAHNKAFRTKVPNVDLTKVDTGNALADNMLTAIGMMAQPLEVLPNGQAVTMLTATAPQTSDTARQDVERLMRVRLAQKSGLPVVAPLALKPGLTPAQASYDQKLLRELNADPVAEAKFQKYVNDKLAMYGMVRDDLIAGVGIPPTVPPDIKPKVAALGSAIDLVTKDEKDMAGYVSQQQAQGKLGGIRRPEQRPALAKPQ